MILVGDDSVLKLVRDFYSTGQEFQDRLEVFLLFLSNNDNFNSANQLQIIADCVPESSILAQVYNFGVNCPNFGPDCFKEQTSTLPSYQQKQFKQCFEQKKKSDYYDSYDSQFNDWTSTILINGYIFEGELNPENLF